MPIVPTNTYPIFDPTNPKTVIDIPDNITRNFGTYTLTFSKGNKVGRISRVKAEWIYNGDYFIYVNNTIWSDNRAFRFINELKNPIINKYILDNLQKAIAPVTEDDAYNNCVTLGQNAQTNSDEIATFLYYSWHRCQVEDRLYPESKGYSGRQMYIDSIISNL